MRYLLDTNIASDAIKGAPPQVRERLVALSALDRMIAAQAISSGTVLVTRDKAFDHVEDGLMLENWAAS